jgi:hypothetical protein
MDLKQRIKAFDQLGSYLRGYSSHNENNTNYEALENAIIKAKVKNQWFSPENSKLALSAWAEELSMDKLEAWLSRYSIPENSPKNIGIIMAGNLPLVGFHDLLTVLLSGNKALIKASSDDSELMPFIIEKLVEIEPEFEHFIERVERLVKPDGVIATGSNNTARYFEAYFDKYPNIIRKNRNSVAVLTGNETEEDLKLLADDLFMYFGLGCRNVTKLYLPKGFDLDRIFAGIFHYQEIGHHNKYGNNYDYYRAIYLLNKEPFLENGFAVMRENDALGSPVAVINYAYYEDLESLKEELHAVEDKIQCIVSSEVSIENRVAFGNSQKPGLDDYADGVDTMKFLLEI